MNLKSKSRNPFLSAKSFKEDSATSVYSAQGNPVNIIDYGNTMTASGSMNKTLVLLLLLLCGASLTWTMATLGYNPFGFMIGGLVVGAILAFATIFKPRYAPYLAPGYAFFEGLAIGGISAYLNFLYDGIVMQAVGGTLVTFVVCYLLYRFKIVKVTEQFKSVVIASTCAIFTYYVISMALSFFGIHTFDEGSSLMSIGFSIFVIAIAALNLFLDFDLIYEGSKRNLPKYMEWYGAMALMMTLVWIYIEILNLLAKLNRK